MVRVPPADVPPITTVFGSWSFRIAFHTVSTSSTGAGSG